MLINNKMDRAYNPVRSIIHYFIILTIIISLTQEFSHSPNSQQSSKQTTNS
jgi:hypothetical protein